MTSTDHLVPSVSYHSVSVVNTFITTTILLNSFSGKGTRCGHSFESESYLCEIVRPSGEFWETHQLSYRPTIRPTNMRSHREVTLPITGKLYNTKGFSLCISKTKRFLCRCYKPSPIWFALSTIKCRNSLMTMTLWCSLSHSWFHDCCRKPPKFRDTVVVVNQVPFCLEALALEYNSCESTAALW